MFQVCELHSVVAILLIFVSRSVNGVEAAGQHGASDTAHAHK